MEYKAYDEYKDSGVEWIGKIPYDWILVELKYLARICNGRDYKDIENENGDNPILGTGGEFAYTNRFLYEGPSVLLGRKGTIDKPQFIDKPFWTVDTLFYTKINNNVHPKLFFYLCKIIKFDYYSTQTALPSMTQDDLNNVRLPITYKKSLQQKIASFLDEKTEKVDKIISKKETLIEKLEEYKKSVITEAVTKGKIGDKYLNKAGELVDEIEMKDSGVDWIGKIPKYSIITRLRYLVDISTGDKDTIDKKADGKYPFFVRSDSIERINSYSYDGEAILTAGDGVGVGKVFHYYDGKFDFHQRVYKFSKFNNVFGKYLYYYLKNNLYKEILKKSAKTTVDSIRLPMLQNFNVIKFNHEVERLIVNYLDKKTAEIDQLIDKTKKSIEKYKEYKKSLIFEAVTGKIDLRDYNEEGA